MLFRPIMLVISENKVEVKLEENEKKTPNHDKYIITTEFNKSTKENFAERLK